MLVILGVSCNCTGFAGDRLDADTWCAPATGLGLWLCLGSAGLDRDGESQVPDGHCLGADLGLAPMDGRCSSRGDNQSGLTEPIADEPALATPVFPDFSFTGLRLDNGAL